MSAPIASAWKVIPTFESLSIQRTIEFYVDFLGFDLGGVKPEDGPPSEYTFCSIFAGEKAAANLYFFKPDGSTVNPGSTYIALGTEQLDMLYKVINVQRKDAIKEEIQDKPWGYRQFAIQDPDGNTLTFFKFLEGGNPGKE
jgi:catechol 2,3-dioxygenase-like lactoylglutathione lyase family enzyme